jgi:hypothetical protein
VPKIASVLAMEENVINGLIVLFTKATPINKNDTPPSKIISGKDSTPSYRPSKECYAGWGLNLPNTFFRRTSMALLSVKSYKSFSLQIHCCWLGSITNYLLP